MHKASLFNYSTDAAGWLAKWPNVKMHAGNRDCIINCISLGFTLENSNSAHSWHSSLPKEKSCAPLKSLICYTNLTSWAALLHLTYKKWHASTNAEPCNLLSAVGQGGRASVPVTIDSDRETAGNEERKNDKQKWCLFNATKDIVVHGQGQHDNLLVI